MGLLEGLPTACCCTSQSTDKEGKVTRLYTPEDLSPTLSLGTTTKALPKSWWKYSNEKDMSLQLSIHRSQHLLFFILYTFLERRKQTHLITKTLHSTQSIKNKEVTLYSGPSPMVKYLSQRKGQKAQIFRQECGNPFQQGKCSLWDCQLDDFFILISFLLLSNPIGLTWAYLKFNSDLFIYSKMFLFDPSFIFLTNLLRVCTM